MSVFQATTVKASKAAMQYNNNWDCYANHKSSYYYDSGQTYATPWRIIQEGIKKPKETQKQNSQNFWEDCPEYLFDYVPPEEPY